MPHLSGRHRSRCANRRVAAVLLFGTGLLSALGTVVGPVSPAVASSTCDASSGNIYQYSGWYASNFANEGLQGDIDFTDISVGNSYHQHGLLYLSSNSKADPNAGAGRDWLQVGYGIGSVDAARASSTEVYEEASDYNTDSGLGAVAHFYSYSLGNHYFMTFFQGDLDSDGRGLYKTWYGLGSNQHYLGEAWEVYPKENQFYAQFEGATADGYSYNCPYIEWGLLGSTGNINDVTSNASTELEILNSNPTWKQWAYGTFVTAEHVTGNYSLTTYELFYLTEPQGD